MHHTKTPQPGVLLLLLLVLLVTGPSSSVGVTMTHRMLRGGVDPAAAVAAKPAVQAPTAPVDIAAMPAVLPSTTSTPTITPQLATWGTSNTCSDVNCATCNITTYDSGSTSKTCLACKNTRRMVVDPIYRRVCVCKAGYGVQWGDPDPPANATAETLCQPCGAGFSSVEGLYVHYQNFVRCYPRDLRFLEPGAYAFTLGGALGAPAGTVDPAVNITVFCVGAGGPSSGLSGGGGGGGGTFWLTAADIPRDQVMVVKVGSAAVAAAAPDAGHSSRFEVVGTGSLRVRYNRGWPGAVAPGGGASQDNATHGVGGAGGVQQHRTGPQATGPITMSKWCAGGDGGSVPIGVVGSAGGGGAGGYSNFPEDIQDFYAYPVVNITWPNCSGGVGGAPWQNGAGGRGEGAAGGGGGSRGIRPAGGGGGVGLLGRKQTGTASGSGPCPACGQGGSSTNYLGGDDGALAQANKTACVDDTGHEWPICGGEYGGGAPGGRDGVTRLGGNGACIVLLPINGSYPSNVSLPDKYGY